MEREVEQNELPIVNKNTRKKQKKLSKMAKMRQKHPISKIIRWICVGKIVKLKKILKRSKKTRFILYLANLYNRWANSQFTYFSMRDWFDRIPCLSSRLSSKIFIRVNYMYLQMFSPSIALISSVQLQFALISYTKVYGVNQKSKQMQ